MVLDHLKGMDTKIIKIEEKKCSTTGLLLCFALTSLVAQMVEASAHSVGDSGSISGSGRSPGEGNGNPLQYSCLENPMDGGTS